MFKKKKKKKEALHFSGKSAKKKKLDPKSLLLRKRARNFFSVHSLRARAGENRAGKRLNLRRSTAQEDAESAFFFFYFFFFLFAAQLQKLAAFVRRAASGPHLIWMRETLSGA